MVKNRILENEILVNLSPAVREVATWLDEQIRAANFGEVGVLLTIHDGKVTRVAKSIVTKQPVNGASR